MKSEKKNLLGFDVTITGIVETLQEAISKSGSEEAVLKDYVSNVLAHSHYTIARREIMKQLETLTGIKRLTKQDGDKIVVVEKEAEYVARLETELGEEALRKFNAQIDAAVAAIPVDYTPGTRGSGATAEPAKKWLAYYDQMVTEGKVEFYCEKWGIDPTQDEESLKFALANKVREIVTAKMKAAAADALA